MNGREKSDPAIVARKPTNKSGQPAAELVERRAGTKGSVGQQSTHRTQSRVRVSQALDRVRQAARQRKKERFTALSHHISVDTLRLAFYALKRRAAPGVDGVRWGDYEAELELRLGECPIPPAHRRFTHTCYLQHTDRAGSKRISLLSDKDPKQ